ncbi:unnamed protein product [Bursaphelenchus okinawaensis]|uniref:Uncharacterized protein n=1 Tax=Bursaphelenchus okinawaensis TaxID=465554 RepID=A0A811KPH9_9BILA|nr:unnamed protein product [Bursaphelenchus okinawaensis]CAG9110184.1 unnamed protein product [Bursaphelenchus okinawaensis]
MVLLLLVANTEAFRYFIFMPGDFNGNPDYLQNPQEAEELKETLGRVRRSEMRNILGSVVFDPQFRRIARNTEDKRMNFQRTGGPILLG